MRFRTKVDTWQLDLVENIDTLEGAEICSWVTVRDERNFKTDNTSLCQVQLPLVVYGKGYKGEICPVYQLTLLHE